MPRRCDQAIETNISSYLDLLWDTVMNPIDGKQWRLPYSLVYGFVLAGKGKSSRAVYLRKIGDKLVSDFAFPFKKCRYMFNTLVL